MFRISVYSQPLNLIATAKPYRKPVVVS